MMRFVMGVSSLWKVTLSLGNSLRMGGVFL